MFPISRDPPEGGTIERAKADLAAALEGFQFLGIPPKGEQQDTGKKLPPDPKLFPISRDPPEGGTFILLHP